MFKKKYLLVKITRNISIISLYYISCFYTVFAMNNSDLGDLESQRVHLSSYRGISAKSSLSRSSVSRGIGKLGSEELPMPNLGQLHIRDKGTRLVGLKQESQTPLPQSCSTVTVYGSDEVEKVNYLASGDDHRQESFAHTRTKTYKGSRKYPLNPYQYKYRTEDGLLIKFDRGHGIDHADGDQVSSAALGNYVPQVGFYNQHIRNPLVKRIRKAGGSYKEITIYDDPIRIDDGTRLPIGFVFMEFYGHKKAHTYYFPNLIHYKSVEDEDGDVLEGYEAFCDFFEIDDRGAFQSSIVEEAAVMEHMRAVNHHSRIGYRSLSGRFQVIPEEHGGIPRAAQIALHRMLAIHHLQQAGELEFKSVEEKAELVRTFSSRLKYLVFDDKDPKREKARAKNTEKFLAALASEAGISEDEYFYGFALANPDKLKPEAQAKYRKMIEIQERYKLKEEDGAGEDLYNLEYAFYWLKRIEQQLKERESRIQEKLTLLELYQIVDLRNKEIEKKEKALIKALEEQGENGTDDEKESIANYFRDKGEMKKMQAWLKK